MSRGRRIAVQAAILGVLVLLYAVDVRLFSVVVGLILLAAPGITWAVAAILVWTARTAPDIKSLVDRADDAVTLAIGSTAGAVIGLVAVGRIVGLLDTSPPGLVLILIAFGLITQVIPSIGWLATWKSAWLPRLRSATGRPPPIP